MAGDYTRCLWPMTSHGVYGRRLHTVTMGFDYTWYLMTATTHEAIPIWIGTKFENPFKFTFLAFTLADKRFCNIRNNFEIL